jgi:hypothetical protein
VAVVDLVGHEPDDGLVSGERVVRQQPGPQRHPDQQRNEGRQPEDDDPDLGPTGT